MTIQSKAPDDPSWVPRQGHGQSHSSKLFWEMTAAAFLLSEWHFCINYRMQPAACSLHMRTVDGPLFNLHPNLDGIFLFRSRCQERISRPPFTEKLIIAIARCNGNNNPSTRHNNADDQDVPWKASSTDD